MSMIRKIDMFAKVNANPLVVKEFEKQRLIGPPGWAIMPTPGWEKAFIPTGKYAIAPTPGWEKAFIPTQKQVYYGDVKEQLPLPYHCPWSGNCGNCPFRATCPQAQAPMSPWTQINVPQMAQISPGTPQGFAEKITHFSDTRPTIERVSTYGKPMRPIIYKTYEKKVR